VCLCVCVGGEGEGEGKGGGATMRTAGIYQPPARFRETRACRELLTAVTWTRAAQAYIDNLKATGQCEDGCIIGLDGGAWTGGLAVTAEEGAAIVAGFDDNAGLRASGIMIAGKKFMYLRNDEEMMCGKAGQGGICIFKTGQACIMGTYNQDMSPANNTKEVGKMADYLKEVGY
jgi:hypothetical protein